MALLALTRCLMVTRPLLIDSLSLKTVSFVAISSNVALSSAYVIIMYFKVSTQYGLSFIQVWSLTQFICFLFIKKIINLPSRRSLETVKNIDANLS